MKKQKTKPAASRPTTQDTPASPQAALPNNNSNAWVRRHIERCLKLCCTLGNASPEIRLRGERLKD